ncbi:MAG: hypothetical protein WDZ59_00115 [Pirellulales bacterium]
MKSRRLLVGGILCTLVGVAWLLPILFELSLGNALTQTGRNVAWLGPVLALGGFILVAWGLQVRQEPGMPASVRLAIACNVLFLAFCALELSDGMVRQDGRIFYWTTMLFLPALLLLHGMTSAQRWAWWTARVLTAAFALWFLAVALAIPFADVRSGGEPVTRWGRVWMIGISLMFVSGAAASFRVLGFTEARHFFGVANNAEQSATPIGGYRMPSREGIPKAGRD